MAARPSLQARNTRVTPVAEALAPQEDMKRKLTREEIEVELGITRRDIEVLDQISCGLPVENAKLALTALRLKLELLLPKPTAAVANAAVAVTVNVLSANGATPLTVTLPQEDQ